MENLGIVGVGAITIICYVVAMIVKATPINNKWLPTICAVFGGILGVLGMDIIPDFPAVDILTAIAVGIVSGISATGFDQLVKQLKPTEGEDA